MWEHYYTTNELEKTGLTNTSFDLEGVAGFVYSAPDAGPVIFYRCFNPGNDIHLLTSSLQEYNFALNFQGFVGEGQAGLIYLNPTPGFVTLWRLRNSDHGDYFYTIYPNEKSDALNIYGYVDEGTAGYVQPGPLPTNVPLYRTYNPDTNDHLYTTNYIEYQNVINNAGYIDEGISCYLPAGNASTIIPLYRCNNKNQYDYLYTTSLDEITNAVNNLDYVWEGISCYVDTVPSADNIPFYRLVHSVNGDHFYTSDTVDRDNAIAIGYTLEGIACNIHLSQVNGTVPLYRLIHTYDAVVHANIIAVGGDQWSLSLWQSFESGFSGAAAIYKKYGMRLTSSGEFLIRHADAGGYEDIDSDDEAKDLTDDWSVVNFAIDVFGVKTYVGDTAGRSAVGGSCDKTNTKHMSGSVVEMTFPLNVIIAHEIGHYLGLEHTDDLNNLMNPVVGAVNNLLTESQASKIMEHCFVRKYVYQL